MKSLFCRPRLSLLAVPVLMLLSAVESADAQDPFRLYKDYDRYRYFPRLPEQSELPPPLPRTQTPITGDPAILVDKLKAIVFVDDPALVPTTAGEDLSGVHVLSTKLSMLQTQAFRRTIQPYIDSPVSILRLNELSREVVLYYRRRNQPVVDVSIPEQDITDGIVYVVVTEARIGKVCVDGACFFDEQELLGQLCISPGGRIFESQLMEELHWLYRNPFRTVDLELTPGATRGQTDVLFHVKDRRPVRLYTGYEDTGTAQTGLERLFYGVNWYNAFNRDDYFGYQYTAATDFDRLGAHSTFYTTALPNRDLLTVYASYADYTASIPGFGPTPGYSWQILPRWYRELDKIGNYEHGVTAGFDFKQVSSVLDFGPLFVFGSTYDIFQFMCGYKGNSTDRFGSWNIGVDQYYSPGNITSNNSSAEFQSVRAFAEPWYYYARGFFERRINTGGGTEFVTRFTGQLAEGNLMPTEQLGMGGYNSVRGYNMYSVLGDSGYFMNFEWWTAPHRIPSLSKANELRGLIFYDVGHAYNHTLLPGEDNNVDLQSIGCGARFKLEPNVHIRFDFGWQMSEVTTAQNYSQRAHVGAVFAY